MDQMKTSDRNPTMVAKRKFDIILEQIQTSNLNFQLQVSPFSAFISLKKTLVKDKFGVPFIPPEAVSLSTGNDSDIAVLVAKNNKLEREYESLRQNYEDAIDDSEASHKEIAFLKNQTQHVKIEPEETLQSELSESKKLVDNLNYKIIQLAKKTEDNEKLIEKQKVEINDLERSNKKQVEISQKFHKELNETKLRCKKEKGAIFKEHKKEVKFWRKELGEETRLKLKLEEELQKTSAHSSNISPVVDPAPPPPDRLLSSDSGQVSTFDEPICSNSATSIINYSPNVFLGEEIKNFPVNDANENIDEILCTICAIPITNYIQKYCLGEAFSPACDKCDDNSWESDENISEVETNDIEEHFEEFLRNFNGEESSPSYETLAVELVKTKEITLDVSMADIRNHNQTLMDLINAVEYKEAFQFLCSTLLKFVKARVPEVSSKKLLVRLVP